VTLIGDLGPWGKRIVLVGGLAPRYIVGSLPPSASPHAGTTDVDLVIQLAVEDSFETYATLQKNLKESGFELGQPSFQWSRQVDGSKVTVDFLCETDQVAAGAIYRPRQRTGAGFGAFNAPGAKLAIEDFVEVEIEAERLDDGGLSKVQVRVAGVLAYVVLKILAFQERHQNKDAYDLIYTLLNYPEGGPRSAGMTAATSPIGDKPQVIGALRLIEERFKGADRDGPIAYANFLSDPDDGIRKEQLRNEAVLAADRFLSAVGEK
jgi:hypothetical protein